MLSLNSSGIKYLKVAEKPRCSTCEAKEPVSIRAVIPEFVISAHLGDLEKELIATSKAVTASIIALLLCSFFARFSAFANNSRSGNFSERARTIAIGQGIDGCSVVFLLTACFDRYMWRYRNSRALRNVYIEAGEFAQRLILSAVSVGFNTFLTPATRDSNADELLDLDGASESIIYLT